MALDPSVLRGRDRYERVTDAVTDNTHDDAFTHRATLRDPMRAVALTVVATPSPEYAIREAHARGLEGDVDAAALAAVTSLAGTRMVAGLTRTVAEAVGGGAGGALLVDAAVEVARLARQVAKFPRARAERAASGDPWE